MTEVNQAMTIAQINKHREALEEAILAAAQQFHDETGLYAEIQIHNHGRNQGEPPKFSVIVKVAIED